MLFTRNDGITFELKRRNDDINFFALFWIISFSLYQYQPISIYDSMLFIHIISSSVQPEYDCPNINQDCCIRWYLPIQLGNFKIALVQNLSISSLCLQRWCDFKHGYNTIYYIRNHNLFRVCLIFMSQIYNNTSIIINTNYSCQPLTWYVNS